MHFTLKRTRMHGPTRQDPQIPTNKWEPFATNSGKIEKQKTSNTDNSSIAHRCHTSWSKSFRHRASAWSHSIVATIAWSSGSPEKCNWWGHKDESKRRAKEHRNSWMFCSTVNGDILGILHVFACTSKGLTCSKKPPDFLDQIPCSKDCSASSFAWC